MKFYLLSHTHWDREWHKSFQEYRVNLIHFMDNLLEHLETGKVSKFTLDGQTIVLEDYLQIKPNKREQIQKFVSQNKLKIGPWYVQPDEFIPSGESHIRNLFLGFKIANSFGSVMKIGYLPDSFGQAIQMPQILNGFDIHHSVFWRGITDEDLEKSEFIWKSLDGSQVNTTVLKDGYGNGRMLNGCLENDIEVIKDNIKKISKYCSDDYMLLMCGFDQRCVNSELENIADNLNHYFEQHTFEVVHLEEYLEKVFKHNQYRELCSDFRKGKDMRVHMGIAMTRMDIKKDNYLNQTLLEKYCEPLATLAHIYGDDYPLELIEQAYKYVIQNQAHDSICCVCTDETHQEMKLRYLNATQISKTLIQQSLSYLIKQIQFKDELGIPLLLINTLANERNDIFEVEFDSQYDCINLKDEQDNSIKFSVLDKEEVNLNDIQIEIGVKNKDVKVYHYKVALSVNFNGLGYKAIYVQDGQKNIQKDYLLDEESRVFDTDYFKLRILENGSLEYYDKKDETLISQLNYFVDNGNSGDEYDYSPPYEDTLVSSLDKKANIEVIHNDNLISKIMITHEMDIPKNTSFEKRDHELEKMVIKNVLTVYKSSRRIDCITSITNNTKNHRVSVCFNPYRTQDSHIVEQHFGYMKRKELIHKKVSWEKEGWEENYYDIYPQQRYIGWRCGNHVMGILNKGLPLYEVNENGEIIIPLLCSTDYMGKQDLKFRPGRRSGLHLKTKDSEMIGTYTQEYAFMFVPKELQDVIALEANNYQVPVISKLVTESENGRLLDSQNIISIKNNKISVSAIKLADSKDGYILRLFNQTDKIINSVDIESNILFEKVVIVNYNEEEIEDARLSINENIIQVSLFKPNECITLKIIK